MNSLFTYNKDYDAYERSQPPAYPWNRLKREDIPRFIKGEDGWWYNPAAVDSDTALLSCVGDLMAEPRMTEAHRYGDSYFFHPLFSHVRHIFHASDFCVANLETTLTDQTPYAGDYHCIAGKYHCNAPACYLDAVRYAGFDALVTANNHNCDSGVGGLVDTLNAIDAHGFMRTGSFLPNEQQRVLYVKINGIKVAILSYGTRYNDLDDWHFTEQGRRQLLNWFDKETCRREIAEARAHGAEFVLCYMHWGIDYEETPNERQKNLLKDLEECYPDYIVGSHTHCLQQHHVATRSDGKPLPMMFSMGNFVTNERRELCKHTGILQLTLRRENGGITVGEQLIPCYVFDEFGTGRFCVVPTDTTLNGGYDHPRFREINDYIRSRVGDALAFYPSRELRLSQLCEALGLPVPEHDVPLTGMALQSGDIQKGCAYFQFGEPTLADRRRALAAPCAVAFTAYPIPGVRCILSNTVEDLAKKAFALFRAFGGDTKTIVVAGLEKKTETKDEIALKLRSRSGVYAVPDAEHTPTVPWLQLHPYHRYCVMELRNDHPFGVAEAARLIRPAVAVLTSECDVEAVASGLETGGTLMYNEADAALAAAVKACSRTDILCRPYTPTLHAAPITTADGVQLVLALATRTPRAALEALDTIKQAKINGNLIAVLGADYGSEFDETLAALHPTHVFKADDEQLLEKLLATVKTGDEVFFCAPREARFDELVRRAFGYTNGSLFGAS